MSEITHILVWSGGRHPEDGIIDLAAGTKDEMNTLKDKLIPRIPDRNPEVKLLIKPLPANPDADEVIHGEHDYLWKTFG